MSSVLDHRGARHGYVPASDYDTLCDEWRVATGAVIMQRQELAELRDELAQRDARIAELEATKLHGEMVMLRTDRDRLAAELRYTIAAYVTGNKPSAGVVDERVEFDAAWPSIAAELPMRLRIRYSAGDVEAAEKEAALESWKHARLNPCRAQADDWVCGNCGSNVQTRLDDAQQKESE